MNFGKWVLFSALGVVNVAFVIAVWRAYQVRPAEPGPTWVDVSIGFVTDFFDTLGIGSFAPTTAIFKLRKKPPDELIPGTLNAGHNPAAFLDTVIFVSTVAVDPLLLILMVGSAAVGAWIGAGIAARLPRRAIQLAMGVALLIAAGVFLLSNLGALPVGGEAMSLSGWRFAFAVGANFVFGALMSVGIGLYAPCMIMLALLGLHPLGAFPIMMGACGLVQPVASLRLLQSGRVAWGPALGLAAVTHLIVRLAILPSLASRSALMASVCFGRSASC